MHAIWLDAATRRRTFESLLAAWAHGSHEQTEALLAEVDQAVLERLAELGLPRWAAVKPVLVEGSSFWIGRWDEANQRLLFAADVMQILLQNERGADRILSAWVHESLHARAPFAGDARTEYQRTRGYEEGLVAGLTDLILRAHDISSGPATFEYYVTAYRVLARTLGVEVEDLWRRLWRQAPGTLRAGLVEIVTDVLAIDHRQQVRFAALADVVFASQRTARDPDEAGLDALWTHIRQ